MAARVIKVELKEDVEFLGGASFAYVTGMRFPSGLEIPEDGLWTYRNGVVTHNDLDSFAVVAGPDRAFCEANVGALVTGQALPSGLRVPSTGIFQVGPKCVVRRITPFALQPEDLEFLDGHRGYVNGVRLPSGQVPTVGRWFVDKGVVMPGATELERGPELERVTVLAADRGVLEGAVGANLAGVTLPSGLVVPGEGRWVVEDNTTLVRSK